MMKAYLLGWGLWGMVVNAGAQTGLVLFTADGQKFTAEAPGIPVLDEAKQEVRLCCFTSDRVPVVCRFENGTVLEKIFYLKTGVVERHLLQWKADGKWSSVFVADESSGAAPSGTVTIVNGLQGSPNIQVSGGVSPGASGPK